MLEWSQGQRATALPSHPWACHTWVPSKGEGGGREAESQGNRQRTKTYKPEKETTRVLSGFKGR